TQSVTAHQAEPDKSALGERVRSWRKEDVMPGSLRRIPAVVFGLIFTGSIAWAQATAQLNGRVTDTSGAALPGVTVTATQSETSFARTAVTDEAGAWVMPNLPIGPYR